MKGLRAEIQLRTTAQHIWAAASHTLQYKQEASVPVPVRRAIHRVSALLETIDLELDRVLLERDHYRSSIDTDASDLALNVDLIEKILKQVFPPENIVEGEPYEELMDDLKKVGITSSRALDEALSEHQQDALRDDARIVEVMRTSLRPEDEKYFYDPERLARGVFFTHVGLARAALEQRFGPKWHTRIGE